MRNLLAALFLAVSACGALAQQTLRLNVSPGGLPPYTVVAKGQPASGLMVELLRHIATKAGYTVVTLEIPRNRVEAMMLQDELDATPRAREWTRTPDDFLFSDPIVQVRDVVFSPKSAPVAYTSPTSLSYKRVGAMLGYIYPVLEPQFESKAIKRVDLTNETSMLAMLKLGRLDAVVINELSALWIIRSENWADTFAYARTEVQSYQYRMMFSKKWRAFVPVFNRELAAMKQDGSLERLLQKYRPEQTVPQF